MRKITSLANRRLLIITVFWLGLPVSALADEEIPEDTRIVEFENTEEIKIEGKDFKFGDVIKTRPEAGTTIYMGTFVLYFLPSSIAVIKKIQDAIEVDVRKGGFKTWLGPSDFEGTFRANNEDEKISPNKTVFEMVTRNDRKILIRVDEGEVQAEGRDLKIKQGRQALIELGAGFLLPSPTSPRESAVVLRGSHQVLLPDRPLIDLVDPTLFTRDID